jgi:hypothetical protein|tara:strand:+ start:78 stop:422 length:345 start_codon:yes stop_codon:yes gene_type:complete
VKTTLIAVTKEDIAKFTSGIIRRRRHALHHLEDILLDHDAEEWPEKFACLNEFFNLLFRFESTLESVELGGEWYSENNYWLVEEDLGTELLLYTQALALSTDELLCHGISLSLH